MTVEVEQDTEKRVVEIPKVFADALKKAGLTGVFSKMSFTNQKEHVKANIKAKREETGCGRITKAIEQTALKKLSNPVLSRIGETT